MKKVFLAIAIMLTFAMSSCVNTAQDVVVDSVVTLDGADTIVDSIAADTVVAE